MGGLTALRLVFFPTTQGRQNTSLMSVHKNRLFQLDEKLRHKPMSMICDRRPRSLLRHNTGAAQNKHSINSNMKSDSTHLDTSAMCWCRSSTHRSSSSSSSTCLGLLPCCWFSYLGSANKQSVDIVLKSRWQVDTAHQQKISDLLGLSNSDGKHDEIVALACSG